MYTRRDNGEALSEMPLFTRQYDTLFAPIAYSRLPLLDFFARPVFDAGARFTGFPEDSISRDDHRGLLWLLILFAVNAIIGVAETEK